MVMNVVFFTQNGSLNNLWRGYFSDDSVKFTHNKKDFFANLNDKVDIVGIDTNAFKDSLDENIKTIHESFPNIKCLILANEPKFSEGKHLLALGVKGYANSHMRKTHFEDAFETILNGKVWLYPEFIQAMIGELTGSYVSNESEKEDKNSDLSELSSREKEIANLIYQGLTNNEIS